jgi:TP901 family phage tail tape measure protein
MSEIIKVVFDVVDNISRAVDNIDSRLTRLSSTASKVSSAFTPISVAAVGALGLSTKLALDFDKSIQGTARAMGLTTEETSKLSNQVLELQKNMNFAFGADTLGDLTGMVSKLGIARDQTDDYVMAISKLAVATDQTKNIEAMATDIAKVGNIFKFNSKEVEIFGSAINALSDATAANSVELTSFTKRAASIGVSAGMSADQVLSFGATMIGSGVQADSAATAFKAIAQRIGATGNMTGKAQEGIAKMGFSARSLAEAFDKDANGAILEFIKRTKELSTLDQRQILGDVFGQEHIGAIQLLVQNFDDLQKTQKIAANETANLAKMTREFDKQTGTITGQLEKFKNQSAALGIQLGQILLPGITSIIASLSPLLESIVNLVQQNPNISAMIVTFLGVVALIAPIAALTSGILSLIGVFSAIAPLVATVAVSLGFLAAPIFAITGLIVALAAAALLVIKNWTPISKFFDRLWQSIKNTTSSFFSWIKSASISSASTISNTFTQTLPQSIGNGLGGVKSKIKQFTSWLSSLASNFSTVAVTWGRGLMDGFITGINSKIATVQATIGNFTKKVSEFLPQSDAKRGALSNLTASGQSFTDTFMRGINNSGLSTMLSSVATPSSPLLPRSQSVVSPPASAPVTINYNISASSSDDLIRKLKARDRELLVTINNSTDRLQRRTY